VLTSRLKIQSPTTKITFPLLARAADGAGYTVLFDSENAGTVVQTEGKRYYLGYFTTTWFDVNETTRWEILPKGSEITLKVE
jgi:hypothetical protein